ncbi:MAG: VanZ family protein [Tildeniella nuda ZEHNDER 1965/U140]|jgi:VanZ family protein|nr:VanZ family protein [Tildeniella nuda ZEHNDER 1965/U140]
MKRQQFKAARFEWRVLAALYAAALLVILYLAYTGNVPSQLSQIPFYDKIGHVVLYGIAAYLGHRVFGYRRMTLLAIAVPLFPLLFGLGTVIEELLQSLSPNRTLDAIDLVASFSGIAIGYRLAEKGR